MKNKIRLFPVILALVLLVFTVFTACGTCTTHVDANSDGKCDVCGENMPSQACTTHVDANSDGKCDVCGENMPSQACTTHVDANSDGKCDVCGENMPSTACTSHVDANSDGKCDVCGENMPEITIDTTKTVSKLEVAQKPKDYYVTGETFTAAGGEIKVTYADGTSQIVPMTAACFEVSTPGMTAIGTKTVTVKYSTLKVSFTIKIADMSFVITYNYGYEGKEKETSNVARNDYAENKKPVRSGYTFVDWFVDTDYTRTFDFTTPVVANAEVYAFWTKDGVTYNKVTFDYDYYGDLYISYDYLVESGLAVPKPQTRKRTGYTFSKWLLNGIEYNFSNAVTAPITLKAEWKKDSNEIKTYIFEAEDTSLIGKYGPSTSGTCQEKAMIVKCAAGKECSNDRFVSFLYQEGNSLEFFIAADDDVSDVTLYVRLSAEFGEDYTYNKDNYGIYVNGVELSYGNIEMKNIPVSEDPTVLDCLVFKDFTVAVNLSLKKGQNLIQLITENHDDYFGTTMLAHAPIVDCIKIKTSGVITWDANFSLPFAGNY